MVRPPCRRYVRITQNSYRAQTRKQWIRQTCPNEKNVTRPAEGGTGIIATSVNPNPMGGGGGGGVVLALISTFENSVVVI